MSAAIILSSCSYFDENNLQNVGMLFESDIENNVWNEQGYKGLLEIEEQFRTDVFYKENVYEERDVFQAVDEFAEEGVNLVIGHGNSYGNHFIELTKSYPDIHFIYMNGELYHPNVTSLNFESHALGFFGGMVAGKMTTANQIGIIAVFSWQPELEGIYEGINYQNSSADIHIEFVNDWDDAENAMLIYESFLEKGIDVVLPIGNAYNQQIIDKAEEDGIYSLGYIVDQQETAPESVLTSLIQNVDSLYVKAAEDMKDGEIVGGIRSYDLHEDVVTLGAFHEDISSFFETQVRNKIEEYKTTNLLPHEN
jgi:transcriptional activator of comK gene